LLRSGVSFALMNLDRYKVNANLPHDAARLFDFSAYGGAEGQHDSSPLLKRLH